MRRGGHPDRARRRGLTLWPDSFCLPECCSSLLPGASRACVRGRVRCHGVMSTCCHAVVWTPAEGQQGQEEDTRGEEDKEEKTKEDNRRTRSGDWLAAAAKLVSQEDNRRIRRGQEQDKRRTRRGQQQDKKRKSRGQGEDKKNTTKGQGLETG